MTAAPGRDLCAEGGEPIGLVQIVGVVEPDAAEAKSGRVLQVHASSQHARVRLCELVGAERGNYRTHRSQCLRQCEAIILRGELGSPVPRPHPLQVRGESLVQSAHRTFDDEILGLLGGDGETSGAQQGTGGGYIRTAGPELLLELRRREPRVIAG